MSPEIELRKVEDYITHHTEALFSNAICPACYEKVLTEFRGSQKAVSEGETACLRGGNRLEKVWIRL